MTLVSLQRNPKILKFRKIEFDITLIDAPKSTIALSNLESPILQGIENEPGSLHLGGNFR